MDAGDAQKVCHPPHPRRRRRHPTATATVTTGTASTSRPAPLHLCARLHCLPCQEDFCVFAGYAGWAPGQLQGEVERDSWCAAAALPPLEHPHQPASSLPPARALRYLAAADSSVLLQELLQQAPPRSHVPQAAARILAALTTSLRTAPPQAREVPASQAGDGLRTWETLMEGIGKTEQARARRERAPRSISRVLVLPESALTLAPRTVAPEPLRTSSGEPRAARGGARSALRPSLFLNRPVAQVELSRDCLSDRTLKVWVGAHLYPHLAADEDEEAAAAAAAAAEAGGSAEGGLVGLLLRTRVEGERAGAAGGGGAEDGAGQGSDSAFLLSEQYMHKALLPVGTSGQHSTEPLWFGPRARRLP